MKMQLRLAKRRGRKSPGAMLAFLAMGCVLALGVLFSIFVLPRMQAYNDLIKQNEQFQLLKLRLLNLPTNTKLQDEDLANLAKQLPVKMELGPFVLALREQERQTGANILSLDNQEVADHKNDKPAAPSNQPKAASVEPKFNESGDSISIDSAISSYKSTGNGNQGTVSGTNGTSGGKTDGKKPDGTPDLSMLQETKLHLSISGTYKQTVDFIAALQTMDRFVNVKEWSFQSAPGATEGDRERVTMQINLSIYAANQFAGKLPQPKAASIPPGSDRTDPTLSQDELMRRLIPVTQVQQPVPGDTGKGQKK